MDTAASPLDHGPALLFCPGNRPDRFAKALAAGAEAGEQELIDHASMVIARYKLPKAVVFRPVIERSPAGKADYRWAREQAVSGS